MMRGSPTRETGEIKIKKDMIITKMVDHNERNMIIKMSLDYNDKDRIIPRK